MLVILFTDNVTQLPGVVTIAVSLEGANARLVFIPSLTNAQHVCQAINQLSSKFTSKPAQGMAILTL